MALEIIKGTEVKIWLDDDVIGRASSATCRIENSVEEYFEIGDRDAVEIKAGNKVISGTLERAVINGLLFSKAIGSVSLSGSIYTISAEDRIHPATEVQVETMTPAADDAQTVFEFSNKPPINGTVAIKADGILWGSEGVDYVIDYENGMIGFASPPSSGVTWTLDYYYGRSYTITFVMQVGDGTNQRLDITVGGLLFDTNEMTVNNSGDTVMETLDYKAKVIYGLGLGTQASGV